MNKTFEDWIKGSGLDVTFGYLVPKQYEPKHFNKSSLAECMSEMVFKLETRTFSQFVDEIKDVQLTFKTEKDPNDECLIKDCFLLHGMLNKIIGSYIVDKENLGIPMSDVIVPKNIGLPLYTVSQFLKIKYGMTTDFYLNWSIKGVDCSKQLPQFFHVKDIRLLENFSPLIKDQNLFFGGSVVGSHYLFQSVKILYEVNEELNKDFNSSESKVITLFQKVLKYIYHMVVSSVYLLQNLDSQLFDSNFRKFFSGFQGLKFEGIQNRLSSSGAAGGLDPLFQLFERTLGIKYQNKLKEAQVKFQQGFPFTILNLFKECQQNFNIRQKCMKNNKLKQCYNKIISQYSRFFTLHIALMQKKLGTKSKDIKYGTAGINIQDILSRNNAISSQKLP